VVLPVAVLALALIMEVSRLRRAQSSAAASRARWLMGGAVAFGALLAVLAGTREVWAEIWDENAEKLRMIRWLRPMIGEFRWLGTGRGAFETVSPAFQPGQGSTVFTHAENFVAQWLVEWGIPVGVAALAILAWHFRPKRMGVGRSAVAAGAWLGVVAVLVQNLVDLGLEIPGVMFGVVVALGSLWGDRRRAHAPDAERVRSRPRLRAAVAIGALVLGALVVANASARGMHDVARDRALLAEQFVATTAPRSAEVKTALRRQIRADMVRHPAEPYFPLVGGILAWQEHDANALPWLQRVLERSLVNGKAHLLLAQVLMAMPSRSQALLELRLAVQSDPTLTGPAATLALKWTQDLEEILSTVPMGEGRAQSLDTLGALATDRAIGARCDQLALGLDPKLPGPHERLGADLVKALGTAGACADQAKCEAEIEAHIKAIETIEPGRSSAARLRASRLAALGKADEAEKVLAAECEKFDDYATCLRERVVLASQIPGQERLLSAEKALLGAVCSQRDSCAEAATWIGDVHAGRGEWGAAVNSYKAAVRDGENADRLLKLATAASRTGMHAQATRALEQAIKLRGGKDPELEKMLADEREQALGGVVGR
jgi:tetratricopeptide (TPR) repeat protein